MNIIEYEVIHSTDPECMRDDVQGLIAEGWQPLGGVMVASGHAFNGEYFSPEYSQAMVKFDTLEMPPAEKDRLAKIDFLLKISVELLENEIKRLWPQLAYTACPPALHELKKHLEHAIDIAGAKL